MDRHEPAPALPDGIASVEILRPQPGDVVVLTCRDRLRAEEVDRLSQYARETFPESTKVIVLADGMTLSVVRPIAPGEIV